MAMKVTVFAGVTNAAQVALNAHIIARGIRIVEDGSVAAKQGIKITWPNGDVESVFPADEPVVRGNITESGMGAIIGVPSGAMMPALPQPGGQTSPASPATQYCQVESLTATATAVRLEEYN